MYANECLFDSIQTELGTSQDVLNYLKLSDQNKIDISNIEEKPFNQLAVKNTISIDKKIIK